jgi:hypothetical protein
LRTNHRVEFDFAWTGFHLLRNRRLIHVIAQGRRNWEHRNRFQISTPAFNF